MPTQRQISQAHVLRGRQIVTEQRERIARVRGYEQRDLSERLLWAFQDTLALLEADLDRLERDSAPSLRRRRRPFAAGPPKGFES